MLDFLNTLILTIIKRPYVVAFLFGYVFLGLRLFNLKWLLNFLIVGYIIAFVSEYASIHTGFPYGWYFYIYANLLGEWLNNGVPVWDSVSYVFMSFAGLGVAKTVLDNWNVSNRLSLVYGAAFFTTLLDIIVDPVTHLGAQWFLGEIYYYPFPGYYFDIPLSNFAGWFLVSFIITAFGVYGLKFDQKIKWTPVNQKLILALYFGIFLFGMSIAALIGQISILLADSAWLALVLTLIFFKRKRTD
ncbi:MAG: carotenoid biosynthesis protein [Deltaproteobacteria bacterium]|nr:carotenoid biosynthesis protein [Deltaproteobacteria bacterium]